MGFFPVTTFSPSLAASTLPFDYADAYGVAWLVVGLLGPLLLLGILLWVGWVYSQRRVYHHSPYSELPLRRWSDLSFASIGKLYLYLSSYSEYDNRMFDIHRAVVCRETGRVFPEAIDRFGRIRLDWTFPQKRYPGQWVSWGSLSYRQQQAIREAHATLDGFQTEFSSSHPNPRMIEPIDALAAPGPLYVDINTLVLLGWKSVPGTDLEVLIVQKPKRRIVPSTSLGVQKP